jgi:Amt family ammonium transporter
MASIAIGGAAGIVCYAAVLMKHRFGYDDTLDAFGVHGVGGMLGAALTGVFASTAYNSAGKDGLLKGGTSVFVEQLIAVGVTAVYACLATFVLLKITDALVGVRVSKDVEQEGLDTALHGEEAYALTEGPGARAILESEAGPTVVGAAVRAEG